jgi:hypothetical protein
VLPTDIRTYGDLLAALRARRDELQVTHEIIDAVTGLALGHTGKLLAVPPFKRLGRLSLEYILGGLALKLTLSEDPEQLERVRPMLQKREVFDWRPKVPVGDHVDERPWPLGMDFPSEKLIRENTELRRQIYALENERDKLAKAVAAIPPLPPKGRKKPRRAVSGRKISRSPFHARVAARG